MKRSILTLVVAFFFVSNLVGQESTNDALNPSWNHAENRHELKFFIGFGPLLDEKHSDLWESMSSYYPGEDYVANSKTRSIGCLSLKYSYDFFDWINVGMEVSYQRDYKDYKFKQYSDSTFEVIANYYATRTINNILIMLF